MQVLEELDVGHIPMMSVWNKVDVCPDPVMVQAVAEKRDNTVCISAQTGQGLPQLLRLIEAKIHESMLPVDVIIPYDQVRLGLLSQTSAWHDAAPDMHMLANLIAKPADRIQKLLQGELVGEIHRIGIVEQEEFLPAGSHIVARVPIPLAMRLAPLAATPVHPRITA